MHVALICPELHGHLNPMMTLGRELARRGHRITLIGTPNAEARALRSGFEFAAIGKREHDSGEATAALAKLGNLTGFAALKFTGQLLQKQAMIGLRDLPEVFQNRGVEAVLVDQVSPAGVATAEVAGLPFVVVCNALALHQEPAVPPGTLSWSYRPGFLGRLRNRMGNQLLQFAARPIFRVVNDYRSINNLKRFDLGTRHSYGLAHIAQQPAFFDYPRERLPDHFHYTGPWHDRGRDAAVEFPWEKLDGRPLVYASLGTLQNGLRHVFAAILEACSTMDLQLVLSLGNAEATWDGPVPANALVVPFAPQLPLIDKSTAVITHAGLNTALESLARGKPMLCIPVTNDQPGVAGRVKYIGAGELLRPKHATATAIRRLLQIVMTNPKYRTAVETYSAKLTATGPGVVRAANIVDEAFATRQRVLRP